MLLVGLCTACSPSMERSSGPLPQSAWVWQRAWTPAVEEAVAASDFAGLLLLAAEVEWSGSTPQVHRVQLGEVLPDGTALVVRVQAPPPAVDPTAMMVSLVSQLLVSHPDAVGVQLDIDLPTRRLSAYPGWLEAVRPVLGGRWLEVTTLPTWTGADALHDISVAADRSVLQVHWLDPGDPTHLLDPQAAEHVEAVAKLGRPFRVGLPACGYALSLDAQGGLVGIAAEQGSPRPPPGGRLVELQPEPAAVAALVQAWTTDRPALLEGLVWFRLPTSQDRRAWPSQTLAAVREGRVPVAEGRVVLRPARLGQGGDGGVWDVVLHNSGEASLAPVALEVDSPVRMAEGVGAWSWSAVHNRFVPSPRAVPLPPSSELVVGWLRTASDPAEAPHVALASDGVASPPR